MFIIHTTALGEEQGAGLSSKKFQVQMTCHLSELCNLKTSQQIYRLRLLPHKIHTQCQYQRMHYLTTQQHQARIKKKQASTLSQPRSGTPMVL